MAIVSEDRATGEIVGTLRKSVGAVYLPGGAKICRFGVKTEGETFELVATGDLIEKVSEFSGGDRVKCIGWLTAHHWSSGSAEAHHHVQLILKDIEAADGQ